MALFKFTLGIGFAGAQHEDECEIDDDELEDLSESQREDLIQEYWQDWANNHIDGGWDEIREVTK